MQFPTGSAEPSAGASAPHPHLTRLGYNERIAREFAGVPAAGVPARLVERHPSHCRVHLGGGLALARPAPGGPPLAALAVGDWVLVAPAAGSEDVFVHACAARTSELVRLEPSGARQVLVANVDFAFLVMGLDGDFNPRRLERYLALAGAAGVVPVVVLTKADACADPDAALDALAARLPSSIDRVALDARSPEAVAPLEAYLAAGSTGVLLGSSGAGKSTLTNTLLHEPAQATAGVRAGDDRGRHTTTARTLLPLPCGGCLIDTPGLRGLRLDLDPESVDAQFADVERLARGCRFRDCTHADEPGCAVRDAVHPDRLANWRKLRQEAARDWRSPAARAAVKSEMKSRQRALRALQKVRGR